MTSAESQSSPANQGLARFAKLVVCATFALIFIGSHTTTSGAGMAFPDWPLSNGSLNPAGWWENFMMRLEHGHRLTAGTVMTLVAFLFGWVLRQRRALPRASVWLASAALVGVCSQAILGGLRVLLNSDGVAVATTFRVLHGCFAQIELCLVVSLAAVLSPVWSQLLPQPKFRKVMRLGWLTAGFIFLQLIVGATMRHLGAGLAIPTYPLMFDGGIMPKVHNAYVDLNFTHTRVLALLVTVHVLLLARRAWISGEPRLARPASLLVVLLVAQVVMGMFVIWHLRPPMLTTLHVVNGAAVFATTVFIAVRASRAATATVEDPSHFHLTEVAA